MALTWPQGIYSAAVACGIKTTGDQDLGVIVAEQPSLWAGTFTRNASAAACVHWCRAHSTTRVKAIVVNSGNANACTGVAGEAAVEMVAAHAAKALGCSSEEILVASTGTIGIPLPTDRIITALGDLVSTTSADPSSFATAILTTDTVMKTSSASAGDATVVGVAKGAAMLAPNMATMLAFLATDATVSDVALQRVLRAAVACSFDRISVDACESTNDSVFLLSSSSVPTAETALLDAVTQVCKDLAEQMVRDAEGGSKFVRIQISGAADSAMAAGLGKAVAASALWRAAANGSDPNWGRVLSALGAHDRSLDVSNVTIAIGAETVFHLGEPVGSLEAASKAMSGDEFTVSCVVGPGQGAAEILSSDLSPEYVKLNAETTT